MPRKARKISNSKIYHVILRGNDKQDIFYDENDYFKYLKELINAKEKYEFEIYAYCLMSNHVHLLIYDRKDQISKAIQSIAVSYSSYFSKKYDKVGHLFQNRFISKNVETKNYLLRLIRYIHQNPVKAGVSKISNYKWSSYNEYFCMSDKNIDIEFVLSIIDDDKKMAIKKFVDFNSVEVKDINEEVEYELESSLTDEQVLNKIKILLKVNDVREIRNYNIRIRNEKIQVLAEIKGTSRAQLARVLGMNRKIVERAIRK